MKRLIDAVLNRLPFNGSKSYLCILAYAAVVGLVQLGYIDPYFGDVAQKWIEAAFGVSLAHKIDKAL